MNENQFQIIIELLKEGCESSLNIKTTKQRERIIEVIHEAHGHLTANQVYSILKQEDNSIGMATVYRNLNFLYENKVINRIQHPDYGYVYDANLDRHYHFHCDVCNRMYDIDDLYKEELNREVEEKFGGKVRSHMTFFYGTCPDCVNDKEKH